MRLRVAVLLLLCVSLSVSCSVSRKLPEGQYLLSKNKVEVGKSEGLSRSERISPSDAGVHIRQKPNKKVLGLKVGTWIHNLSNPEKDNGLNRWLRKVGEGPVVYDSLITLRSVDEMSLYMRNRGFADANVDYKTDTVRRKKIRVTYHIDPGKPYRIGPVSYEFQDRFLEPMICEDSTNTLIRTGDVFDKNILQAERRRIAEHLKDRGYYSFNVNNISYRADTTNTDAVALKVIVKQHIAGYDDSDRAIMENNAVYSVGDIFIEPEYDPVRAVNDPSYYAGMDTLRHRNVNFVYDKTLNVKPDVLLRAINIYPSYLYNETDINRAYDNVMKLNYYRNIKIIFSEAADTTLSSGDNMITYVGDDGSSTDAFTQRRLLDYHIQCIPGSKQSYSVDLEATTTSNYYGLLLTLGYQHKNIFKGVELLEVNVTGGYEFMRINNRRNSFEVGGGVALTMPRFMTPFKVDRYNRMNNVKTRFEFSVNSQNRPYYRRILSSGSLGYSWTNNHHSSFVLRPVDVSMVKMNSVDDEFLNSIQNPYLRNSYNSQLIAGISSSFLYNNQVRSDKKNSFRVRINAETNGNLIYALNRAFHSSEKSDSLLLFGVQFAQYARADVDASYRFRVGERSSLVYRLYVGAGMNYGNSKNTNIPFERLFYGGGPNSMRGWQVRTLGPGNTLAPEESVYPTQLGNFKLETNVEFRFPVYGLLNGALFADVGNIWLIGSNIYDTDARFSIDSFYKQLGFAGGLGARFDFGFFLFRIDWGVRIHDPNKPKGYRWISDLTLRRSSFNFGIGFPF